MTIDEAIKHCLEVAEDQSRLYSLCPFPCDGTDNCMSLKNGKGMGCTKCAADHRQLAEWLTDYKELKNSIGAVKLNNMKEALKLIRAYKAENIAQKKMIAEYKRLLKSATNVLKMFIPCDDDYCSECIKQRQNCEYDDRFKWLYTDEALKLIGGETDEHS